MPKGTPQIQVAFDIDSNGILTVTATEISSKTEAKISVSTDRGDYTQEDIDKMLEEADYYKNLDKIAEERINIKNRLDNYIYKLSKEMKTQNTAEHLEEADIFNVNNVVKDTLEWLEENENAKFEDFKNKEIEVMLAVEPILSKLYIPPGIIIVIYYF